jgi:hypothetical protein
MPQVIAKPYIVRDGKRVLQCHSRGDKRFSPFFCYTDAFGVKGSIENHYHHAKLFGGYQAKDWRDAKRLKDARVPQTGWIIGGMRFPVISEHRVFAMEDWGIQWYIALWWKYLLHRPDLIAYAKKFDEFEDPFAGRFPFCQARVIEQVTREGLDSLKPMFSTLVAKLQ